LPVSYLLDSVVLIDHFNAVPQATAYIAEIAGESAISVITRAEILAGFDPEQTAMAKKLLDCFPLLIMDKAIADLAAGLRRENRWKLPDAIQAAIAQHHNLELVTRNSKDFPPNRFGFVRIPYHI